MTGADRITNALETSQFKDAFDPKTREAVVSIFELGAKMAGKDLDTFLDDNFSVQIFDRVPDNSPSFQGKKGGTRFIEAGKALINTTNWSDLSTIAHEVQHVVQLNLPEQYRAEYSKVFGIDAKAFDKPIESLTEQEREGFEKAARAFEEYLYTGEAPTAKLKTLFDQIKDFMRRIYTAVRGDLTPDAQALFDRMLGAGTESNSSIGTNAELFNTKKRRSNAQAGGTGTQKDEVTRKRDMGKLAAAAVLYQNGEYEEVYNRYHDAEGKPLDGTLRDSFGWMKAPNGKPTNLTEQQWVQVRTPAFKKWFGDWETAANAVMPRSAQSVEEAAEAVRKAGIIGKPLKNTRLGIEATISGKSLDEMANEKATKQSVSPRLHALAVANVDALFERAQFEATHQDTHARKEVEQVHRLGSLMRDGADGEYVPVMLTVIEYKKDGNRLYTVEAIDVESMKKPQNGNVSGAVKTTGQLTAATKGERQVPIADFDTSIAQLFNSVKGQVSKVVDENGEPLVVYHSGTFKKTDIPREGMHFGTEKAALDRTKRKKDQSRIELNAVFLNIRNPEYTPDFGLTWENAIKYAKEKGRDGIEYRNTHEDIKSKKSSYIAFSPTQIKSATDNAGTFDADNPSILYQSIGELGAQALDAAEDATTRLDNLSTAKAMEKAGKDARAVRLATGWERGADGKWRYEITDLNMSPEWNKALAEAARSQETLTLKLGDIADAPELFEAYPQLKNIIVYLSPYRAGSGNGSYQDGFITVSGSAFGTESTLAHEVQHAIQDIEGFAEGGSPEGMADRAADEGDIASWWNDEGGANEPTPYFILTEAEKQAANERYREEYAQGTGRDEYHRLAGEVEARNTQSRLRMSPHERLVTLLAETEDVAREDQIIIENALDRASIVMASRSDPLWYGSEQEILDYASGFDTYEAMLEDAGVKAADLTPDEKALFERIYHTVHPVEMGVDLDADGVPDWVTKPLDEVLTGEETQEVSKPFYGNTPADATDASLEASTGNLETTEGIAERGTAPADRTPAQIVDDFLSVMEDDETVKELAGIIRKYKYDRNRSAENAATSSRADIYDAVDSVFTDRRWVTRNPSPAVIKSLRSLMSRSPYAALTPDIDAHSLSESTYNALT